MSNICYYSLTGIDYKNQFITSCAINSDRLVFNAKEDSILLFSDKAIGFSTNGSFHFDTSPDETNSKFVINSPLNRMLGQTPHHQALGPVKA